MVAVRPAVRVLDAKETIEGAGVRLRRAFGYNEVPLFDPFLMLDDFRGDKPEDYRAGFPWHPHRGIETVTYVIEGRVEHEDSLGNAGSIRAGDVQWMTAGSGIVHQEMPKGVDGAMGGFQVWVNLPASQKMMEPRYREVKRSRIPEVSPAPGVGVRVICGEVNGVAGPVKEIVADPAYFDVSMEPGAAFVQAFRPGYTAFAYVVGGSGSFGEGEGARTVSNRQVVLFGDGDGIRVRSYEEPLRFLLLAGKPIREPVAWSGPIVMNTREELEQAFREYRDGTFVKAGRVGMGPL